jgi:F-type H+-transporting ATPase subunit delta
MPNPRLATRYAKSILDLAKERGEVEQVYNDMLLLQQICKGNRDFVVLLKSPVITPDKKIKIVEAITAGKVSEMTHAFNRLLINKAREASLPEIAAAFIKQYKEFKNIHTIKLISASPLGESLIAAIVKRVKSTTEMKNIEVETTIDNKLIGGFVLQVGDQLVDASIAHELKEISKQFENNDFIYKLR